MQTRQSLQQAKATRAVSQTHNPANQQSPEPSRRSRHPTALIQRVTADPRSLTRAEMFQLQRTIGNRAVGKLLRVQPKLIVGPVGDTYEREADRVATRVVQEMRTPVNSIGQRQESEEQDQVPMRSSMRRLSTESDMAVAPDIEAAIHRARGGGQPLPPPIRDSMEQTLGADFSGVRIHTDAEATALNRSLQARAFTTGQDIFLRQQEYKPSSREGQTVLAHELMHVVQQRSEISQGAYGSLVQRAFEITVGDKTVNNSTKKDFKELKRIRFKLAEKGNKEELKRILQALKEYRDKELKPNRDIEYEGEVEGFRKRNYRNRASA